MDIQPQSSKPISDDQELSKVLAGVNPDETIEDNDPIIVESNDNQSFDNEQDKAPVQQPAPYSSPYSAPQSSTSSLDGIKKDALLELRPILDKLSISQEDKFDVYLLLIRSTDDKSLIAPAHDCARQITDEARRAQALLDIIKEIDYLSAPNGQAI